MKINYKKIEYGQLKAGNRVGIGVLVLVLTLGLSGSARADWSADAMGEGSGLDRGVVMSGEASLRASIESATQMQQIASSMDYTAMAGGSFGSGGIGVMAVSAGDDVADMGA